MHVVFRRLIPLPLMLSAALGAATLTAEPAAGEQSSCAVGPCDSTPSSPQKKDKTFICDMGSTKVKHAMNGRNWAPVNPSKWRFPGTEISMTEPGAPPPGPRRPFEYAVLNKGPEFGSVQIDAQVRLDTPVEISNRDVIIVFNYQSPTKFYYAHFSRDNTFPHNGIFMVNNADRVRLDDQFDGSRGAPPAIKDAVYHKVRVSYCAESGEIRVYVDGSTTALMTATDKTFSGGRTGFGSFDNIGSMRGLSIRGTSLTPKK